MATKEELPFVTDPKSVDYDIAGLTQHTVDQLVVDGEVDGAERRAPHKVIIRIAFQGSSAEDQAYQDFNDALVQEPRFVDHVQTRYGYSPVVSEESTVRPSLKAIVGGNALCTEAERAEVLADMNALAEKVFLHAASGVLSLREVSGTLKAAGRGHLSYEEYGAFLRYIDIDPRFEVLDGGRVVLVGHGNFDGPPPPDIPRINDFTAYVEAALPQIWTGPNRVFGIGALLGTLKAQGTYVREDQLVDLYECLQRHPGVRILRDGRYQIGDEVLIEDHVPVAAERELSLNAMIRMVENGRPMRKPRSKRRGGWKRVTEM